VYVVTFRTPVGYERTKANQGSDDTKDSDADQSTGSAPQEVLLRGENNLNIDAGFSKLSSTEILIQGNASICINQTTQLSINKTGGVWSSNNNSIAVINQSGLVTAINGGDATFNYKSVEGQLYTSKPITIIPNANIAITDPTLCIGETSFILSDLPGGVWISSNPAVARIDTFGMITANSAGFTQVRYREPLLGCITLSPTNIVVNTNPTLVASANNICGTETATISASPSAGAWSSNNSSIAMVSSTGLVTPGLTSGIVSVTFTAQGSGCRKTIDITVLPIPIINSIKDTITLQDSLQLTVNGGNQGSWRANNPDVATIDIQGRIRPLKAGLASFEYTNLSGCKSAIKSILIVQGLPKMSVFCYTDANKNNIYDADQEFPLPNCVLTIAGNNTLYYTGIDGYAHINLPLGSYSVNYSMSYGQWENPTILKNIVINKPLTFEFAGFRPILNAAKTGDVIIKANILECKKTIQLKATAYNKSSEPLSGYLSIAFDPRSFLFNATPLPVGGNGDTLIWAFNNLQSGNSFTPDIAVYVPEGRFISDTLSFFGKLINRSNNEILNQYRYVDTIRCGPRNQNEMITWPNRPGIENYTLKSEEIIYTVDFQNKKSGNRGTVQNVKIFDDLDPNLDVMSLRMISSSHPVTTTTTGNMLLLEMKDMNLVDDATNSKSSQGYVSFAIKSKPATPNGTKIYNRAAIQMDNSPKRQSTTVLNTIVSNLLCSSLKSTIVHESGTLRVSTLGKQYSWYDCSDNFITSAITNDFKPSKNGSYYAFVEGDKCNYITECYNFISTSTSDLDLITNITISPNPSQGLFTLDREVDEFTVRNVYGQEVRKGSRTNVIDMTSVQSGVYYIELIIGSSKVIRSIIKVD
jgi:hypothetical protein